MSSNNICQPNINARHALPLLLRLIFIELVSLRPAHAQSGTVLLAPPPTEQHPNSRKFNPSLAIIMVVLVTSFFLMGFFSIYVRRCTDRRRGNTGSPPTIGPFAFGRRSLRVAGRGLDPSVVESFPTFLYGSVKGHKINKAVPLECAVCLNEFNDDETLRLIPQCCHVFHPDCIDSWLSSHTTCPVCRTDLTPKPGEVISQIPVVGDVRSPEDLSLGGSHSQRQACTDQDRQPDNKSHEEGIFRTTADQVAGEGGPRRSRSTGMRLARMFAHFPRSRSTGHLQARAGEDQERFTLRLPEEVMWNQAIMSRTKSCVAFPRESSLRSGYRTRSNRGAFTVARLLGGSGRSRRGVELDVDAELGETSSDRPRPRPKGDSQR